MIDNTEIIRPILRFDNPDLFYYIQLLQRKKENPQLGSNSRSVNEYYVNTEEKFNKLLSEIKDICNITNARAMIRLNRRSYEQVALRMLEKQVGQIINKDYRSAKSAFSKTAGQYNAEKDKTWILDVDLPLTVGEFDTLKAIINSRRPVGEKVVAVIPSVSGCHVIVRPFDLTFFADNFDIAMDLHKDNPTNLYIP